MRFRINRNKYDNTSRPKDSQVGISQKNLNDIRVKKRIHFNKENISEKKTQKDIL